MITDIFFREWIHSFDIDNISWKIFQQALVKNMYLDGYMPPTYNKVKGDIFEYITKFILMQKYEVYLYNEIPLNIRQLLKLPNIDRVLI